MPAIITNKFRINNSEQFSESFSETANQVYYLGIGRPQPFGTSARPDNRTDYEGTDTTPITPGDTVGREFYTFDDLIAANAIFKTLAPSVRLFIERSLLYIQLIKCSNSFLYASF